jgi:hypothetical protein
VTLPSRLALGKISTVAQPRYSALGTKQGIGNLASHHVDLIRSGDCDKYTDVLHPSLTQSFRVGRMIEHTAKIVALIYPADLLRIGIDNCDV